MNLMFIFFIIAGFILTIYSLVQMQKSEKTREEIFTIEEGINKIKEQIAEADQVTDELNSLAEEIFLEFQEKKKELMFLYELIDQKQKSFSADINLSIDPSIPMDTHKNQESSSQIESKKYDNPLFDKIPKMQESGMSISEIAKNLNIGKGEVELILNLWKESSHE